MKKEYDFSKGERGKFYRPDIQLNLPVYLEPDVRKYFPDSTAVNEALRCLLPLVGKKKIKPSTKLVEHKVHLQILSSHFTTAFHGSL